MNTRIVSKMNFIFNFFSRIIYLYPLLIGTVILFLSYFARIGQYGMGFAFALSSVLYYSLKRRFDNEPPVNINLTYKNHSLFLILNIIFLISFSLSLVVLHESIYIRPVMYFLLVTIAFVSILIEIFHVKSDIFNYLLLLKIIILSMSLRIGRFYGYPSILGTDTHFHLNLARFIIQNGKVPGYFTTVVQTPTLNAEKYSYSCLFHIFEAINGILLNVNLKDMIFYSIVLFSTIIISLFLYCIVKRIFNNQIGLIAALYINIADVVFVQTVTNINPSTIVYCFFIVILFCIFQQKNKSIYSLIAVTMIICMILSHQLSTFCVFLILLTLLVSKNIYNAYFVKDLNIDFNSKNPTFNLYKNTMAIFSVILIFYWSLTGANGSYSFFDEMIFRLKYSIISMIIEYTTDLGIPTTPYSNMFSNYGFFSSFLYNLGFNFLLMLAIVGIILLLGYKYRSLISFSYICAALMLFGLIYVGTFIGLGYLLIPHRLLSFFQLFLVVFASFSTYQIYKTNPPQWAKFGLHIAIVLLVFFLITTPYINRGDIIYSKDMESRDQCTYSELKSLEWSNYFPENQTLFADPFISQESLSTINALNIAPARIVSLKNLDTGNYDDTENYNISKYVLIRQHILDNPNSTIRGTFGTGTDFNYDELIKETTKKDNLIYYTDSAKIYQKIN